ncbi:hypothetical protein CXB51_005701 [Gossypium anomalum]|uniref:CCHC-type domain-containing protein n=1 Tax=Gossypium anomalum TaxID=47600 RepID=A0A8J5ZFH4_9ROSI|nr:hypothetical protein CXB51_005701 [Gossypium anomalum]
MSEARSLSSPQSGNGVDGDSRSSEVRTTKKVRFKDGFHNLSNDMAVDHNLPPNPSWKDKLLGGAPSVSVVNHNDPSFESDRGSVEEFDLLDEDVKTTIINGILAINFSDRIKEMLFKEMELTGPWIIFGQYLTVQPWTKEFNPAQPYPSVVLVWIRLPGLPSFLLRRKIVEAIGGIIGKPLVSKVLVDGKVQRVEYEALPTICFGCGKYGHVKDFCPMVVEDRAPERPMEEMNVESAPVAGENMLVERRSWRGQRSLRGDTGANNDVKSRKEMLGSRYSALNEEGDSVLNEAINGVLLVDRIDKYAGGNDDNNRIVEKPSNDMMPLTDTGLRPNWKELSPIRAARVGKDLAYLGQVVGGPGVVINMVTPVGVKEGALAGQQFQAWKMMEKQPLIGSSNFHSSGNEANLEVENLNDSSIEFLKGLNARNYTNITAHFNPAFEQSGGVNIPITSSVLDSREHSAISFKNITHKKEKCILANPVRGKLGEGIPVSKEKHRGRDSNGRSNRKSSNALRGRGSHFKSSGNSKVPLAESMEEMAKLISNSKLSSKLNAEMQGVAMSKNKDNGCASDKFPHIFREYNQKFSPDIISLLETRVSGAKVDNIIARLGFPHSHCVEAISFSVGIWVCWKNTISVEIIFNHPQFILARVGFPSPSMSVFISFVYVDFNAIFSSSEKSRGMSTGRRCPNFGDFVEQVDLHDLGYRGPRSLGIGVHFLKDLIEHWEIKPGFRWVEHPNFGDFVKDKWSFSGTMTNPLTMFTHDLKEWNKSVYGHISARKKILVKELTKIQRIIDCSGSNRLAKVELKIQQELENVLRHEELLWKQKARCDWLHFGDRNIKFFHARMLRQRKHNWITAIRNEFGDWLYDSEAAEAEANQFFQKLYGEDLGPM